ncbi:MAG: universal stress protein [Burkholderiales bacterium]
MYKHILLPTDGSELSERAIREGIRFAKFIGARLTALHTTPQFYPTQMPAHSILERSREHDARSKESARHALDPIEQAAREADVACTVLHRVSDSPWEEISKVAIERGCDLILMASHGRRGVSALLLGSETNKVLTHSKIPVLVTR